MSYEWVALSYEEALRAFGPLTGAEWVRGRGDTVTLLRWAVHVPTGARWLVPASTPYASVL